LAAFITNIAESDFRHAQHIAGRKIHPMYLFEVKKPEESKAPWDYYKQLATIPAEEAWRPLDQSECPLVKK